MSLQTGFLTIACCLLIYSLFNKYHDLLKCEVILLIILNLPVASHGTNKIRNKILQGHVRPGPPTITPLAPSTHCYTLATFTAFASTLRSPAFVFCLSRTLFLQLREWLPLYFYFILLMTLFKCPLLKKSLFLTTLLNAPIVSLKVPCFISLQHLPPEVVIIT